MAPRRWALALLLAIAAAAAPRMAGAAAPRMLLQDPADGAALAAAAATLTVPAGPENEAEPEPQAPPARVVVRTERATSRPPARGWVPLAERPGTAELVAAHAAAKIEGGNDPATTTADGAPLALASQGAGRVRMAASQRWVQRGVCC